MKNGEAFHYLKGGTESISYEIADQEIIKLKIYGAAINTQESSIQVRYEMEELIGSNSIMKSQRHEGYPIKTISK